MAKKKKDPIESKVNQVLSELALEREEQMNEIFNFNKNKQAPEEEKHQNALATWGHKKK